MPNATRNTLLGARITYVSRTGGTTSTIDVVSRLIPGSTAWPILRKVGEIGIVMGQYLPNAMDTTITLDNQPGSLGYQRKISDLLDRHTFVAQAVTLYAKDDDDTDTSPIDAANVIWSAKVKNFQFSTGNDGTLILSLTSDIIPRRTVTKLIETTQFPNAPAKSLGKYLPLVFGDSIEVIPLQVDADGDSSPAFAYCTTLGSSFVPNGVNQVYAKNHLGKFVTVQNPAAVTTEVLGVDLSGYSYSAIPISNELSADAVRAVELAWSTSTAYVLTQGYVYMDKAAAASLVGSFTFEIWTKNPDTGGPGVLIGQARRAKAGITFSTSAANKIEFAFDRPVVLNGSGGYFFAIRQAEMDATANIRTARYTSAPNTTYWVFENNTWVQYVSTVDGNPPSMYFALFAAKFTDDVSPGAAEINEDDLGHAFIEVTQKTAISGVTNPALTDLDLLFVVDGLNDTPGGTVTASASARLRSPQHIVEALLATNVWSSDATVYDASKFSATHTQVNNSSNRYYRDLDGATEGRVTMIELLEDICRHTGCRIAQFNGGTDSLGLWAWGTETDPVAVLSDEDLEAVDVQGGGTESIVNRVMFFYDKRVKDLDISRGTSTGQFRNWAGSLDWYNGKNSLVTALANDSEDAFGKREVAVQGYPLIGSLVSAERLAEFLMSVYSMPTETATLRGPWGVASGVDLLDVVEIVHPDLPAHFGTSPNPALPAFDGETVEALLTTYPKRGKRYRAIVEGKRISFDNSIAVATITARLLNNFPTDPT